jgi:hypothetical protein
MTPGPEGDALHLDHIVELIDLIRDSLAGSTEGGKIATGALGPPAEACRTELKRIDG